MVVRVTEPNCAPGRVESPRVSLHDGRRRRRGPVSQGGDDGSGFGVWLDERTVDAPSATAAA